MRKRIIVTSLAILVIGIFAYWYMVKYSFVGFSYATLGNTMGNISEDGNVVALEDYCYFSDNHSRLSVLNVESAEVSNLSQQSAIYIQAVGDTLYFTEGVPGRICSMKIGEHNKRIHWNKDVDNLIVSDTFMVFRNFDGSLMITDLNMNHRNKIWDNINSAIVGKNSVYFIGRDKKLSENFNIYSYSLRTGEVEKIHTGSAGNLQIDGEYLYFTDKNKNSSLMRIDLNTLEETMICDDVFENINICDGYVFYRNVSDNGSLYRLCLENIEKQKLGGSNVVEINTVNDRIYYQIPVSTQIAKAGHYSVKIDGTDLIKYEEGVDMLRFFGYVGY